MSEFDNFFKPENTEQTSFSSDTDLSGLDVEAAREYVLSFITSLKQLQKQMMDLGLEIKTWQERILFAKQRNRDDLAGAATSRLLELESKQQGYQQEERELSLKVRELLENLKKLKAGFSFSIDAEKLQAELEMIVGEKDEVADKFKEEETLAELERMKARLNAEQESTQDDPSSNSAP